MSHFEPVKNAAEIGVLGAGRLGTTLALALVRAGHAVGAVASREPTRTAELAERLPDARAVSADALVAGSATVVLAVPDDAIAPLAQSLAWRSGQRVVHCSGALGLDVLEPARAAGALRGCFHPLQTFPERFADPVRLHAIAIGIEGDGELDAELHALGRELGATPLSLAGVDRARYHAAAVFASNYVVALHAAAARAFAQAGLTRDAARAALAPLTAATADAIARLPLPHALTGPIARGDARTVERHLQALAVDPELRALYAQLGAALLDLPLALAPERRATLEALLRGVV
jgi:predicted short-subunit dehydrogenase-like oxidoreductase (DUF2520 family)